MVEARICSTRPVQEPQDDDRLGVLLDLVEREQALFLDRLDDVPLQTPLQPQTSALSAMWPPCSAGMADVADMRSGRTSGGRESRECPGRP
jgi:hypothetical protein